MSTEGRARPSPQPRIGLRVARLLPALQAAIFLLATPAHAQANLPTDSDFPIRSTVTFVGTYEVAVVEGTSRPFVQGPARKFGGNLTLVATFDDRRITADASGTGGVQPDRLTGNVKGTTCQLKTSDGQTRYVGICDRNGFKGTINRPVQAFGGTVSGTFELRATRIVDLDAGRPAVAAASPEKPAAVAALMNEAPFHLPALGSLPRNDLQRSSRAAYTRAIPVYVAAMQRAFRTQGISPDGSASRFVEASTPFIMAGMAARRCRRPELIGSNDLAGRACYLAGLYESSLVDQAADMHPGNAILNGLDYFARCADLARLRQCALMHAFMSAVIGASPKGFPDATLPSSSAEAEVLKVVPLLKQALHARDVPPALVKCLPMRTINYPTTITTTYNDMGEVVGRERHTPLPDEEMRNLCGKPVSLEARCGGSMARPELITLGPGEALKVSGCILRMPAGQNAGERTRN